MLPALLFCLAAAWIPASAQRWRRATIRRRRCMSAMGNARRRGNCASFQGICDRLGIRDRLVVRNEALRAIGGSALDRPAIAVPESARRVRMFQSGAGVPVTYVPFPQRAFSCCRGELGGGAGGGRRSTLERSSRTVPAIPTAGRSIIVHSTKWCGRARRKGPSESSRR